MENFNEITSKNHENLLDTNVSKKVIDLEDYELISEGVINPFNKNNKPINPNIIQNLLKKYGNYQNIHNLEIYQTAFVHTSYTTSYIKDVCLRDNVSIKENPDGYMLLQDESYEKIEFLGDTIIESIIGTYVYRRFKGAGEGFLSNIKKQLISRWTLGHLAKKCNFNEYMVISKTQDDKRNARNDIKKLCDVFEAFIAAIYLDFNNKPDNYFKNYYSGAGYQIAEKFLINLIEDNDTQLDITELIMQNDNYKSKLKQYLNRMHNTDPVYNTTEINIDNNFILTSEYTNLENIIKNCENNIIYETKITTKKNSNILGKAINVDKRNSQLEAAKNALLKFNINLK